MTQPLHAREVKGKGRWYGSCGEDGCPLTDDLLISVTNAQDVVNKPALAPAAAKATAAAAWELLPQMVHTSRQNEDGPNGCQRKRVAERCGTCRFCINSAIKAAHKVEWETKRELGTRIHAHAHAHVLGKPMPLDEEVEPFLGEYSKFLRAWDVDLDQHVEAAETTIFDRANRYAGTGDLWVWLPITPTGRTSRKRYLWLVDIKTSLAKPASVVYVDQVLQLAGLRYAPKAILPDDTEVDVPDFAGAAILNLRPNAHAFIPQPADRDAHAAFVHAVGLQMFLQDQDVKSWQPLQVPVKPEPKTEQVA